MLYAALVLASIVLLLANLAVHRRGEWFTAFFLVGGFLAFGTGFLGISLIPVTLLYLLLALSFIPWRKSTEAAWRYLPLSLLAFAVVFGIAFWSAMASQAQFARLRSRFPTESLDARLGDKVPQPSSLTVGVDADLRKLESRLDGTGVVRRMMLQRLHDDAVVEFVNSPGFGVSRGGMHSYPQSDIIAPREEPAIAQPDPSLADEPIPDGIAETVPDPALPRLLNLSIEDFVSPGFGFVKDRQHVAGFRPHRFSQAPKSEGWSVRRVELVSLLLHKEPVVYASDTLPRMDDVRAGKTRPLDEFEHRALARLRKGEPLVA